MLEEQSEEFVEAKMLAESYMQSLATDHEN